MDGSEIASLVCLGLLEVGMVYLCIRKLSRPPPAPHPTVECEESRSRRSTLVYLELEEA